MAEEFETCIDGSRKDGPSSSFPRVKIAVLDTGADLSHPDIIDATQKGLLKYYDFVKNESTMSDLDGHGTHCTSLLLKFAPNAEIHIGRVFQRSRAPASSLVTLANVSYSERLSISTHSVQAIKYATETWEVDIISISLGFPEVDTDVMQEIKTAAAKPVLIFASAANNTVHERKPIRFPAQMKEVFCIFSADTNSIESAFNPKPRYDRDNFMFPGENIEGAWPLALAGVSPETETREGRTYRRLSGTSCATPIAAAVAAGVLEFAWQGRETKIRRVEMLKHFDGMKDVFLEMLDKYKPGDGCYHYVKPWKLITARRPKSEIPVLLSYIIEQINA
jgi:subtilisin family serine protease